MGSIQRRFQAFVNNRWLVFVAAIWIQAGAGVGYLFGSISPVIKSALDYNQRQLASLGVAKNLGDSVGFVAGSLAELLPFWGLLLIGAFQTFVGYGWVWLIVTGRASRLPLWGMLILVFVGTNGETYYNTAALVSCVQNFPRNRGPIVGILKGFAGLSGAILTQIYRLIPPGNHATLILMIAVLPSLVVLALMFIIRPVGGHKQARPSDGSSFTYIYSVCLVLAAYLMGVMIFQEASDVGYGVVIAITAALFVLLLLPIAVPTFLSCCSDPQIPPLEEDLLPEPQEEGESSKSAGAPQEQEVIFSEVDEEKTSDVDRLPSLERQKRIAQLQSRILQAAAEGAVRVKRRRRPRRGEDFTLLQAFGKADFWLIFLSLLLGSGSGLTVIDNLGQITESLGYGDSHTFVSMISIWNFLGRVGGGFVSEIVVRDYAFPRPAALGAAQVIMAIGHFLLVVAWPGVLYFAIFLVGLGYGAHWAIVPATASELFGLKNFGALYNFLTVANPAGSLAFSGLIASTIYDYEAARQSRKPLGIASFIPLVGDSDTGELTCRGAICFSFTFLIMCGMCIVAFSLSTILVLRTRRVYSTLYDRTRT